MEKDLSLQQQLLDVVIIKVSEPKTDTERDPDLPDGLEVLTTHNLLTFKSHHEALDGWALNELVGHYVNYRKQSRGESGALLPERAYQLLAVSARFPQGLASEAPLERRRDGVYDCLWGSMEIRVLVLSEMSRAPNNALWHLFSARAEQISYGVQRYRWRRPDLSTVVNALYEGYEEEGVGVSYTVEDFVREYRDHFWSRLSDEERHQLMSQLPA